jgi:hypothetical protein
LKAAFGDIKPALVDNPGALLAQVDTFMRMLDSLCMKQFKDPGGLNPHQLDLS